MDMKQIKALLAPVIVLLVVFVNASKCYAVEDDDAPYRPFVENGKSWVVTSSYAHGWWAPFMVECYYIDGDTLMGSQPCKKLMLRTKDMVNNCETITLDRLIYEIDKKVYCYHAIDGTIIDQPVLLYDFSASIGDTLSLGGVYDAEMTETRCFKIWNTPQLAWHGDSFNGQLASYNDPQITESDVETEHCALFCWYESIGATDHPFTKLRYDFDGVPELLRDCRVGDKIIYTNWVDSPMFPDFTGDGLVDIADVNQVTDYMLGKAICEPTDVTGDGQVDIADVNAIIDKMLGK